MQIDISVKNNVGFSNTAKLILKIIISLACLMYVYYKLSWETIVSVLYTTNWLWILAAIGIFIVSKILSAYRLHQFFSATGTKITHNNNIRLYWLGMFYNQFLPGSISGDAFKVAYLFKKKLGTVKWLTWSVLLDRVSGVTALTFIASIIWLCLFRLNVISILVLTVALSIIGIYFLVLHFFMNSFRLIKFDSFYWSIAVQFLQMVCMFFILNALGSNNILQLLFIFSVASIVAVLPLSIGGIGAREIVFLWGAHWLDIDAAAAVTAGFLFYLVNLLAALPGCYFIFSDPFKTTHEAVDALV